MTTTTSHSTLQTRAFVLVTVLTASLAPLVQAAELTLKITSGASTAPVSNHETVLINATVLPVSFPPNAPPNVKRDLIRNGLQSFGYVMTDNGVAGDSCTAHHLPRATFASLATENTGTLTEKLVASDVESGKIVFTGHFSPNAYTPQSAIFTAGIVTDLGTAVEQISASELNFQTDGPIICQALFQRLAPRAPQYGAQINYAGDRLEVYFDPAYTVAQGGIIFGTTSPSPGCTGQIVLPVVEPEVTLTVEDATNPNPTQTILTIPPVDYPTTIQPFTPANPQRDAIAGTLESSGRIVTEGLLPGTMTIHRLTTSDRVTFQTGETGEADDSLAGAGVHGGRIGFTGTFASLAYDGQPAIFRAGIVTDLGTAIEQISATELNFQTDGPIICQALFQRLAPRAPQYGAQINYAGDRLEVYFDPAYTVTQGGIIFGTTSPSPGCSGTLVIPGCEGENNCSGHGDCAGPNVCQCLPGWSGPDCSTPGFSPPGTVLSSLTVTKSGVNLSLQWGPSCLGGGMDYEIYEGNLGAYYTHQLMMCSTGSALAASFLPTAGSHYYLVVPRDTTNEGSYGQRSNGIERPPGAPACLPGLAGACP